MNLLKFAMPVVLVAMLNTSGFAQTAPAGTAAAEHVLLVPFGPPGNTDYQLDAATNDFATMLTEKKNMSVERTKAMDVMDVAGSASDLCHQFHVTSIFLGTVRHEQNHNIMWGTYPTHAEVRISQLGCDGKTKWKGVGVGDKVQYWSNPAAAVTNVIQMALAQVISEMP